VIRPGRRGDVRAVAELEVRAWRSAYADIVAAAHMPSVQERAARWDGAALEGLFVRTRDERLEGFVAVGARSNEAADHGALRSLYVDPAAQGAGVGAALHDHALGALREAGFTVATLWVFTGNARARAFYARRGWEPDGHEGEGSGAPGIRLWRALT
jgi:GNAT superfamily N-acetyltransferase